MDGDFLGGLIPSRTAAEKGWTSSYWLEGRNSLFPYPTQDILPFIRPRYGVGHQDCSSDRWVPVEVVLSRLRVSQ